MARLQFLEFFASCDPAGTGRVDRWITDRLLQVFLGDSSAPMGQFLDSIADSGNHMVDYTAFLNLIFGDSESSPLASTKKLSRSGDKEWDKEADNEVQGPVAPDRTTVLTPASDGEAKAQQQMQQPHQNIDTQFITAGNIEHSSTQQEHGLSSQEGRIGECGFGAMDILSGPCMSMMDELPELGLQALFCSLKFAKVIGKGTSGATVLRGTMIASSSAEEDVGCAAKVLPLGAGTFPDMVEDFGREVEIMQSLRHPGLVKFLGAGRISSPAELGALPGWTSTMEAYVLCMELCDLALEQALRHRCQEKTFFDSAELGSALAQLIAGLAYLHDHRILHRDLKSANVFLKLKASMAGGEVAEVLAAHPLTGFHAKLGDFSCCAAASRAQTPVQTPQWMAPEVIRMEGYSRPADVWGLGMLIYELLELGIPYGEDITMPQLEAELIIGRAPPLSKTKDIEERAPFFFWT